MKRLSVLLSLLIAMCAFGQQVPAADGAITVRSYDRVVIVAVDTAGDGNAHVAFVAGLERRLEQPLNISIPRGHVEVRDHALFVTDGTKVVMTLDDKSHLIGIANYPDLAASGQPLRLSQMPKSASDDSDPAWAEAALHHNWE